MARQVRQLSLHSNKANTVNQQYNQLTPFPHSPLLFLSHFLLSFTYFNSFPSHLGLHTYGDYRSTADAYTHASWNPINYKDYLCLLEPVY